MFVKYNSVLRGVRSTAPFLQNTMVQLCCPAQVAQRFLGTARVFERANGALSWDEALKSLNRYQTTLHGINSAIIKLGKLTFASRIYRGIHGMALPKEFWQPNAFGVKGGIENGFMSTVRAAAPPLTVPIPVPPALHPPCGRLARRRPSGTWRWAMRPRATAR